MILKGFILLSCLGDVSAWRRTAAGIFETIVVKVDFVIISAHLNFLKKKYKIYQFSTQISMLD